jgi:hypothetical protein
MQKYKMEPFCPIFREVAKILDGLPNACFVAYYKMLLYHDVKEVLASGQWIQGEIKISIQKLSRELGVSRGWLMTNTMTKLAEAGLVRQTNDGRIIFPKYKKRKDQYILPETVKQELQGLHEQVEALKQGMAELQANNLPAKVDQGVTGNRSGSDRLPVTYRPVTGHPGHYIEDQKRSSLSIVEIVNRFYIGAVGHAKLTRKQRAGAQGYIKTLLMEFSKEEVIQAIDWTVENVKDLRSIKILDSTFHQAIAVTQKQKSEIKKKVELQEAQKEQKAEYRKEREQAARLEAIKNKMEPGARDDLRSRAILALEREGTRPPIGWPEIMITLRENAILRQEEEA